MSWGGEAARWSLKFSGGEADTNLIVMIVRYSNLTPKWIIFVSKTLQHEPNRLKRNYTTVSFFSLSHLLWLPCMVFPSRALHVTTYCVTSFLSCPSYHTLCYVLSEQSQLPHTMLCPFRAVPVTTHYVMSFQSCPSYHTLCCCLSELPLLSHPVISF